MSNDGDPRDFAWRVHGALDTWTGRVDTKASIVLAVESAAFAFVVTQSDPGKRFNDLHGAAYWFYLVGIVALLAAILLALRVVMPQLKRRQSAKTWRKNMIYFGHLRHWDPDDLARALERGAQPEAQLARQLVAMSTIAWKKHARLQWSLGLLVAAMALLGLSVLTK